LALENLSLRQQFALFNRNQKLRTPGCIICQFLIAEIPYCASILCSADVSAAPDSIIDQFPGLDIHNAAGGSTGGKPSKYCSIGFWQTTPVAQSLPIP
jgi:hypothetical protein